MKKKLAIISLCLASIFPVITPLATPITTMAATQQDGWVYSNNNYQYYKNGKKLTGWAELGVGTSNPDGKNAKHWSYFDKNGNLLTGWQQMGGNTGRDAGKALHWSYFGTNGWLRTGWVELGQGTSNPDNGKARHWSYFGENGWLRTGLQTMGTSNNPDNGQAQHLSFFDGQGWLKTNTVVTVGNTKYTANSIGWLTSHAGGKYSVGNGRKAILIGDSRTNGAFYNMYGGYSNEVINVNKGIERWIAKGSQGYTWMVNTAIPKIEGYIDSMTDVIILMGINDTYNADKYASYINNKANIWAKKGARTYYVSANPVKGKTTAASFNKNIKSKLNSNVKWINTHDNIKFIYTDGIHYNATTNKNVINYVLTHR